MLKVGCQQEKGQLLRVKGEADAIRAVDKSWPFSVFKQ